MKKTFTLEEIKYFNNNIDNFTLEEKIKLLDTNIKEVIEKNLLNICLYGENKEIREKVFKSLESNKLLNGDNLEDICLYSKDEQTRNKAFDLLISNKLFESYNLVNICNFGEDLKIREKAFDLGVLNKLFTIDDLEFICENCGSYDDIREKAKELISNNFKDLTKPKITKNNFKI